jgi:hypothetical protein
MAGAWRSKRTAERPGVACGTLKNGNRTDYWVRWTGCFRNVDGNWLIVHDQVSVLLDMQSGKALLNLKP